MLRWLPVVLLISLLVPLCSFSSSAEDGVRLIGSAKLPGDAVDASPLKDTLPNGTPHNRLGSLGSSISYLGRNHSYLLAADRGPDDGAVAYRCRFHELHIDVQGKVTAQLRKTWLLSDAENRPLIGLASAIDGDKLRFDPEGLRVGPAGTIFISDEYGPYLREFDPSGKELRAIPLPEKFRVSKAFADPKQEIAENRSGRVTNKGMEGLAITPAGDRLIGAMQGALIQDGGKGGSQVRLVDIHLATGAIREWVYVLEQKEYGLSEIVAINDSEFLVIERDSKAGSDARHKRITKINLKGATDVSGLPSLPTDLKQANIQPVSKQPFFDLLDPAFGLAGPDFPAKIEGLAFGPDLPNGDRLLIVTSDNDFKAEEPTWIYCFAIPAKLLPGYVPQLPLAIK